MSRQGGLDIGIYQGVKELLRSTRAFLNFDSSSVGSIKKLGGGGSYARDVYLIPYKGKNYILKFTEDPAAVFAGGFPGREILNLAIVRENQQLRDLFDEQAASDSLRLLGMISVLAYQDQNKKLHYGILMEAANGNSILQEMNEFVKTYGTSNWQISALKVAALLYSFGHRLARFHLQFADQSSSGPIKETIQHRDLHGENAFASYPYGIGQKIFDQTKGFADADITKWAGIFKNFSKEFSFSLIDLDTMALSIPGGDAKWLPGSSLFLSHKLNRKVVPEGDLIKPVMYHLCALVSEHRLWDKNVPMPALMKYILSPFIVGYLAAYPSGQRRVVAEKMRDIMMESYVTMNTNAVATNPTKLNEVQKDYIQPFFSESNLTSILNSISQ
jgi:hypothetical protein